MSPQRGTPHAPSVSFSPRGPCVLLHPLGEPFHHPLHSPHPTPVRDGGGTGHRALGQAGRPQTPATSHDQRHRATAGAVTPEQPPRRLPDKQRGRNASTRAAVSEPGRGGAARRGCHGGSPGAAPRRLPAWTRRRREISTNAVHNVQK